MKKVEPNEQLGISILGFVFAHVAHLRACLSTFFFDRKSEVENKNPDLIGRDLNHLRNKLR